MHPRGAHPTQSNQAFTLAEVMMATVVTMVALVGLIAAVTMGSEMLDVSRKQTIALQILRNETESIHLQTWTMVSNLPPSGAITINTVPLSAVVTVNSTGNDVSGSNIQSFALTNYGSVPSNYNLGLLSVAKEFTLTLSKTTVVSRPNLFVLTYTVTWTAGNRRKTYVRTSSTYYGKTGLNLYYQK